jgi:hypothetical protein
MKETIVIILRIFSITCIPILLVIGMEYCESKQDPYEEGMHSSYSIICEGGFKYKCLDHRRGTIPLLNSDGTPLRCNKKRY